MADTTVNFNPSAEELAEITLLVAKEVRNFNIIPGIAHAQLFQLWQQQFTRERLVAEARHIVKSKMPTLLVDGEMQTKVAFNKELMKNYPFSELVDKDVNTLIFQTLLPGNIATT